MKKASFKDLVAVMAHLRGPKGCPWDRVQTHKTLVKYLKEESDEMILAIRKGDMENLEEELGDILLQVLFHSQLASERGEFDIYDVLTTLKMKLVGRHPHVFKSKKMSHIKTAEDVRLNWDELKKNEKQARAKVLKARRKKK